LEGRKFGYLYEASGWAKEHSNAPSAENTEYLDAQKWIWIPYMSIRIPLRASEYLLVAERSAASGSQISFKFLLFASYIFLALELELIPYNT